MACGLAYSAHALPETLGFVAIHRMDCRCLCLDKLAHTTCAKTLVKLENNALAWVKNVLSNGALRILPKVEQAYGRTYDQLANAKHARSDFYFERNRT